MKKRFMYLLLSSSLICILSSCSSVDSSNLRSTEYTIASVTNEEYLNNIENSSKFTRSAKLLDSLNQNENIMISMTSLDMALGMVLNGSIGETKEGMEAFIGMSTEDANTYYQHFLNTSKENEVLNITNSVWINDNSYKINDDYNQEILKTFDAVSNVIPFNDSGKNKINSYVSRQTSKMIPNLLDSIDSDGVCYVINTLLFDGKWKEPFPDSKVRNETFTTRNNLKETVEMMSGSETFYMENEYASGFKKSYTDNKYSFIGILPKEVGDIVVSDLDIDSLLNTQTNEYDLTIGMPTFNFSTSINLRDVLMRTDLSSMFDKYNNDIINIINTDNSSVPLFISDIIQKTKVENTKEGTKATAATAITKNTSALIEKKVRKEVILNRPFVFIIIEETTQEPLFMGIVQNPNQ